MANGQIKETQSLWANYYIHLDTLVHHSIIILSDNLRISKQFAGKLESTSQSKKKANGQSEDTRSQYTKYNV